ncbi:hypothetical protein SCHPADRAFT_997701 [Schizopora paradoxa]|uniref:Uncharacterized protein n=1 Tax=Schizopora paradoxa TaxID=27342 RepID=A0A0H2RLZ8_9AGAM|nr:hypothetical protein SCHPADRAFT_997701 [Schizopora paradoxa]
MTREGDIPFKIVTSWESDFIHTITDAIMKYALEGPRHSDAVKGMSISESTDKLISETIRLDYALRTVGSGGPGMERANAFRNLLRVLRELIKNSNSKPSTKSNSTGVMLQVLRDLEETTEGLHTALADFIGITFNEKLMASLNRLRGTLKNHYDHCGPVCDPYTVAQLEKDLAESFISLQRDLEKFIDEDIRSIKSVQNNGVQGYVNLTVIATFLSGVTASVIQIVGPTTSGSSTLAIAVNVSLFSSLIFSTASAAQSLLAMIWMQSFVRLPEKSLPHVLYAWLHRGPLISLLVSGALFAVGLVIFVYSSKQDRVTSAITTTFATLQTLGILCLTVLFIRDRWKFRRQGGITGLKLTKFSILFNIIEGIERTYKRVFHPPLQERSFDHCTSSIHCHGESPMKENEIYFGPTYGSHPSPSSFRTQATPNHVQLDRFIPADVGQFIPNANVAHSPVMIPIQEQPGPNSGQEGRESPSRVGREPLDDTVVTPGRPKAEELTSENNGFTSTTQQKTLHSGYTPATLVWNSDNQRYELESSDLVGRRSDRSMASVSANELKHFGKQVPITHPTPVPQERRLQAEIGKPTAPPAFDYLPSDSASDQDTGRSNVVAEDRTLDQALRMAMAMAKLTGRNICNIPLSNLQKKKHRRGRRRRRSGPSENQIPEGVEDHDAAL